ncbi:MAG: hypothetical protein PWQ31_18 [Eubacteriales bacterium]|nr:hypothetical protein [Eubacteriales bacterium]
MKRKITVTVFFLFFLVATFALFSFSFSEGSFPSSVNSALYLPNEIIVKTGSLPERIIEKYPLLRNLPVEIKKLPGKYYCLKLPPGTDTSGLMTALKKDPEIVEANYNHILRIQAEPNDPSYPLQWNLKTIRATASWNLVTPNSSVYVAVIDTGIDPSHPDLASALAPSSLFYNAIDGSCYVYDDNGHGTHVAGIIAATANNSTGIAGAAAGIKILPIKALYDGGAGTESDIAAAIDYATRIPEVKVINLSMSTGETSNALRAAIDAAIARGITVVAASGNEGKSSLAFPAAYPEVVSVGATDRNDNLASFSNYGTNLDVVAPGVAVLSTLPGGGYGYGTGTSMAAPHVSALAALMYSYNSSLQPATVEARIKAGAVDLGSPGSDSKYGFGRVDFLRTLQLLTGTGGDFTPPTVTSTSPLNLATTNSLSTLSLTCSETISKARLFLDGQLQPTTISGNTAAVTLSLRPGFHVVTADLYDSNYNRALYTWSFTYTGGAPTPPVRLSGNNRYETAIAVARRIAPVIQEIFPDHTAPAVILATGTSYPDALTGASLRAFYGRSPLLLLNNATTDKIAANASVLAEAERMLTPGGKVILLGGTGALSDEFATYFAGKGYRVERIGGSDRYETAVKIAGKTVTSGGTVLVVSGENFPDALSVAPYAAQHGYPILLVPRDSLPDKVASFLQQYRPATVIIVGGPRAIAGSRTKLKSLLPQARFVEIAGSNRYDTCRLFVQKYFPAAPVLYVTTGENFPDALAGGPLAGLAGAPLLLTASDHLPPEISSYLASYSSPRQFYVLGGTIAVSDQVLNQLR